MPANASNSQYSENGKRVRHFVYSKLEKSVFVSVMRYTLACFYYYHWWTRITYKNDGILICMKITPNYDNCVSLYTSVQNIHSNVILFLMLYCIRVILIQIVAKKVTWIFERASKVHYFSENVSKLYHNIGSVCASDYRTIICKFTIQKCVSKNALFTWCRHFVMSITLMLFADLNVSYIVLFFITIMRI